MLTSPVSNAPVAPISPVTAFFDVYPPIPDEIIVVANELIRENLKQENWVVSARFTRDIFLNRAVSALLKSRGLSPQSPTDVSALRNEINSKMWLDIEHRFRKTGWKVSVEEMDSGETCAYTYIFTGTLPATAIDRG